MAITKNINIRAFRSIASLTARVVYLGLGLAMGGTVFPANAASNPGFILGDYDAEPRKNGHVDTDFLVQRLTSLGVNTYMWLVWHGANDWQDLTVFLPKAEKAGINVWVYLAPPSETAATNKSYPYSEPYRLDYTRWAQEIAKLSLKYPNIKGYVLDDFWLNATKGWITRDSIRSMVAAGKAINPNLKFYPLMYLSLHQVDDPRFIADWAPLLDGVIGAYPPDSNTVDYSLTYLQDRYRRPGSVTFIYPPKIPSHAGDHARVTQTIQVTDAAHAQISFTASTDIKSSKSGYHQLQVLLDNQVVWEGDATRYGSDDTITVNLSKHLKGKQSATLSLGIADAQGVGNYPAKVTLADLNLSGLKLQESDLSDTNAWQQEATGAFSVQRAPAQVGEHKFHLPLIAMVSGDPHTLTVFNHIAGTPENIANGARSMLKMAQEGKIEGVVTYCLNLDKGNANFNAVQKVFQSIGE